MNIMTREEKISYWMELADYDVVTAEARYPSYKSALARELNETVCGQIIERTKNLKQWIENKL